MGMPIPILVDSDSESSPQRKRRRGGNASDSAPASPSGGGPQSPQLSPNPRLPQSFDRLGGSAGLRRLLAAADRTDPDFMRRALRAELDHTSELDIDTPEDSARSDDNSDSAPADSSTHSLDSPRPASLDSPPFRSPSTRVRMAPGMATLPTTFRTRTRPQNTRHTRLGQRFQGRSNHNRGPTLYPVVMPSNFSPPPPSPPPPPPVRARRYGASADRPASFSALPRARRRDSAGSFRFTRAPAPFGADVDAFIDGSLFSGMRIPTVRRSDRDEERASRRALTFQYDEGPEFRFRGIHRHASEFHGVPHDITRTRRGRSARLRPHHATGMNLDAVRAVEEHYRAAGRNGVRPRGRLDLVQTYLGLTNTLSAAAQSISVVYVDESAEADVGRWWELGVWTNGAVVTGRDVFQMLMDVLTECAGIARCKISSLVVCDGLEKLDGVQHAIQLLKNLSEDDDGNSSGQSRRVSLETRRASLESRRASLERSLARRRHEIISETRRVVRRELREATEMFDRLPEQVTFVVDDDEEDDTGAAADVAMQERAELPAEVLCSGAFVHPITGDLINIVLE